MLLPEVPEGLSRSLGVASLVRSAFEDLGDAADSRSDRSLSSYDAGLSILKCEIECVYERERGRVGEIQTR